MADGMIPVVTGRFVALVWHGIATIALIFGKTPLIQIEVDPAATIDLRIQRFEYIDTWWVLITVSCYSAVECYSNQRLADGERKIIFPLLIHLFHKPQQPRISPKT